ncbi:MAG: hypothetical protein Q7S01_04700 [bacterium]|nr:hypothetical protein [bacterium]
MIEVLKNSQEIIRPIVGSEPFNLSEADVVRAIHELRSEVKRLTDLSHSRDGRLKLFARNLLPKRRQGLELITSHTSPAKVLEAVKNIYQRVNEAETAGTGRKEIIAQIYFGFPELINYGWLLQRTTWGRNLYEALIAVAGKKELGV